MIKRDKYLSILIQSINNGFPKVITGVRRCGKSYLLKNIFSEYLNEHYGDTCNQIIIELDILKYALYRNPIELDKYVKSRIVKDKFNFVFIDEIQLVDTIKNPIYCDGKYILANKDDKDVISFVDVVLGLSRLENVDLYITGSNSKMLSSDIVTEFRDKATNINIQPLSFDEFYSYENLSKTDAIYEYMQYGGMPLAVLKTGEDKKSYLKQLFTTTYFKDILEHNRLEKSESLDALCNIISENCGQLFNSEKISNVYQSKMKQKIDKDTVTKYINCFIDSFVIREAKRYDVKGLREIGALRKFYFVDNGLRNARVNFAYDDEGQMLENIVYNELIYNGFSVSVGTFEKIEKDKKGHSIKKNYEIDFVAKRGIKKYYIQVSSDISSQETRAREIKPYVALTDQIQKILVINKPIEETIDHNGFTVVSIADFLLKFIKQQ